MLRYIICIAVFSIVISCDNVVDEPHDVLFAKTHAVLVSKDFKLLESIIVSDDVSKVVFSIPDGSTEVYGFVVGPGRVEVLPEDVYIIAMKEGSIKEITFEFSNGNLALGYGSGMANGLKLSESLVSSIKGLAKQGAIVLMSVLSDQSNLTRRW
jgi:hypothetical protein